MEKVLKVDDLTCRYRPTLEWGMFFSYELVPLNRAEEGGGAFSRRESLTVSRSG